MTKTATTAAATTDKPARARKPAPALVDRMKTQLSAATLKGKITVAEIDVLHAHLGKLKSLMA